jgi:hypothetical protein
MQVIELAGCADGFGRERGEPRTTMARLEEALRPVIDLRVAHVHPDRVMVPPPIAPVQFGGMVERLTRAVGNLDNETGRMQSPSEVKVLNAIKSGLAQIVKDGLVNEAALRTRDLHYAGYYHEIQLGRLAKATELYANRNAPDPRHVYINRCIYHTDDLAHQFYVLRGNPDKSQLPVSVVAPNFPERVPDRLLSELMRELRRDRQPHREQLEELQRESAAREKEENYTAVRGLARQYARVTGDPDAGASIHDYVERQKPRLDREMIDGMRKALEAAAAPGGGYLDHPEAVCNRCLDLAMALEVRSDGRLIDILDAADARSRARTAQQVYEQFPSVTRLEADRSGVEDRVSEIDREAGAERGPGRRR